MSDAAELRAMVERVRAIGESRRCVGNEITCMLLVDFALAGDELVAMIERDDERARQEFAAEAPTAPASLFTQPGIGVRR